MFRWYREIGPAERRTFWACLGGWSLDALDVQMFSLAIPALIAGFGLSRSDAGLIGAVTLIAAAFGDGSAAFCRTGSVVSARCRSRSLVRGLDLPGGLRAELRAAPGFEAPAGLGFGAEWAAGAVLMAEAIRPEHRGKALGAVQGGWAIGWGAAVLLSTAAFSCLDQDLAWRVLFACGLAPALFILYLRRFVPEPARPRAAARARRQPLRDLLARHAPGHGDRGAPRLGAHGGFHALFMWLPTYLSTERGASVLGTASTSRSSSRPSAWLPCRRVDSWTALAGGGRWRSSPAGCMALVVLYLLVPVDGTVLLLLGAPLGFCAAGIPASLAALFSELFPSGLRGTGMGFCYNAGRLASAALPLGVGLLSEVCGLGPAIGLSALAAYGLVLVAVALLPDARRDGVPFPHTPR